MMDFIQHGPDRAIARASYACASLPGGQYLSVTATLHRSRIELALTGDVSHCMLAFDVDQARAVAAELLAAADALEPLQGGAA